MQWSNFSLRSAAHCNSLTVPLTATLFLVAGDEQRDRAALGPAAIGREIIGRRGHKAGNAAFHVDRAAAVEHVALDLAAERRMLPRLLVARRHHVGMAGKHQIGLFVPMRA